MMDITINKGKRQSLQSYLSKQGPKYVLIFPELLSVLISSIPVQLVLHFYDSILLHPSLCVLDSLQNPSLWSLRLAFV
jgi:hypothetical protein